MKNTDQYDHCNIDDYEFMEAINNFFSFSLKWIRKIFNQLKKRNAKK